MGFQAFCPCGLTSIQPRSKAPLKSYVQRQGKNVSDDLGHNN